MTTTQITYRKLEGGLTYTITRIARGKNIVGNVEVPGLLNQRNLSLQAIEQIELILLAEGYQKQPVTLKLSSPRANLFAWSARCDCRNGHSSSSGRCNARDVTDPTRIAGDFAACERCRAECPCGKGKVASK